MTQRLRIRYQSSTSFDKLPNYAAALRAHAVAVLGDTAAVDFQGLPARIYGNALPGEVLRYPYLKHLVQDAALEACVQAAATGIDAFIVGSFSEPALKASRAAVDIPVLSLPESALLTACTLAERFALITLSPRQSVRVDEVIDRHALRPRSAGCFDLGGRFSEDDLEAVMGGAPADALVTAFTEAGRRAMAAGADLLIPAEGLLNEVIQRQGLHRIDGAAVMDCVGVALLHAEMIVRAGRVLKLGFGREWSYPVAAAGLMAQVRAGSGLD